MRRMVFLLEELSAERMLKGLMPRLVIDDDIIVTYHYFEGKTDLEKNIIRKISYWKCQDPTCFVILRDQDSGDCINILNRLKQLCFDAGRPETLIRIACRELESWYLGDLDAVQKGLELRQDIARLQNKARYREPDLLVSPSRELARVTANKYQKVNGSSRIGCHLKLDGNKSYSFKKFIAGIRRCHQELLSLP